MYMKFESDMKSSELYGKMINNEQTGSLNATRSCCYGSQRRPLSPKSLGGILSSERGQSRDAFQAIPLEETSPRCNKSVLGTCIILYYTSMTVLVLPSHRFCPFHSLLKIKVLHGRYTVKEEEHCRTHWRI